MCEHPKPTLTKQPEGVAQYSAAKLLKAHWTIQYEPLAIHKSVRVNSFIEVYFVRYNGYIKYNVHIICTYVLCAIVYTLHTGLRREIISLEVSLLNCGAMLVQIGAGSNKHKLFYNSI